MAECALLLGDGIRNLGFDDECRDLEPFFFDEVSAVAEHAAAEEKRRQKEEEEARKKERNKQKAQAHLAALDRIREFDDKRKCFYFTRFYMADLSILDLDEESPLGPMRYTDRYTKIATHECGTICNQGGKWFKPSDSTNVLSVNIAYSSVGFPVNVYGTVIARDSLDYKCVSLFNRNRDHCQVINCKDESLILTGPKRGLALKGAIYFEVDLKIKGDQGQGDKELSKGLLKLDGIPLRTREKMLVESDILDSKLSTVEVVYAVVKRAVEATITVKVLHGEFNGRITARTASISDSLVLYDSKVAGAGIGGSKGTIQLLRPVIAVCVEEMLLVTFVEVGGSGKMGNETVFRFKPAVNGGCETEVTCGSCAVEDCSVDHRTGLLGFTSLLGVSVGILCSG